MMVYNIGNLLPFSDVRRGNSCGCLVQESINLHNPQQVQNNEDNCDDEQGMNHIATPRNTRVKIRAEVSD